jgi:hypothetical protein
MSTSSPAHLKIASTVAEYVPHTHIGWYGTGDQLPGVSHLAAYPRNGNSTYVVMEETGLGRIRSQYHRNQPAISRSAAQETTKSPLLGRC